MPELPEVETVRRSLTPHVTGRRIEGLTVLNPTTIGEPDPEAFGRRVIGRRIERVERRAKYLLFPLDDGSLITVHLRMTGRLVACVDAPAQTHSHTRLLIHLDGGVHLRFDDQRKFGRVSWFAAESTWNATLRLGPEPIDPEFDVSHLQKLLSGRRRPIKSLLLDQTLISGLGNIYADEALFRAGIAPTRPAASLSEEEIEALWRSCRDVLLEGIAEQGTTLRDYVDGEGRTGRFQERLKVYGRIGQPCVRCGRPLERVVLSGRSSSFCPHCQR